MTGMTQSPNRLGTYIQTYIYTHHILHFDTWQIPAFITMRCHGHCIPQILYLTEGIVSMTQVHINLVKFCVYKSVHCIKCILPPSSSFHTISPLLPTPSLLRSFINSILSTVHAPHSHHVLKLTHPSAPLSFWCVGCSCFPAHLLCLVVLP